MKQAKCLAKWYVLFLYTISHGLSLSSCLFHLITHFLFHPFSCIIAQSLQPLTSPLCTFFLPLSIFFTIPEVFFHIKDSPPHSVTVVTVDPPPQLTLSRSYSTPWRGKTHKNTHTVTVSTEGQHSWGCLSTAKQTVVVWHPKKILLNILSSGSLDSVYVGVCDYGGPQVSHLNLGKKAKVKLFL